MIDTYWPPTTPLHLRNPNPRPWWSDNALTAQARAGYERRHERPAEWADLLGNIRAEVMGGAVYAADVVAMVFRYEQMTLWGAAA